MCLVVLFSAGLIILFYVAFYIFLAAFFCLTMYALLMTLEDNRPKHQDRLVVPGTHINTPA